MARRGRGEGNIRKRKDGRWEGSKTVGLTLAGNPKRRSVYGKTRAEVARKLEELTTQFNYGTLLEPDKRTVKAFGQQWLEMKVSGGISSKTKMDYEYELGKTDLTIGALRLQDVKPVHIREVLKRLELDQASPRTRAKVLERLNCVFTEAIALELIHKNPCAAVKFQAPPSEPIGRSLELEEVTALLAVVKGDYWEVFIRLCLNMGLRKGEALALQWADIDFKTSTVKISKSFSKFGGGGKMGPTKGRRNRVIPLPPSMAKLLLDQAEQWDFDKHPEHKKLFLIGADKPLNPSSPNHAMKKLCVKAGVKPCRVHDLRHTYGSLALRAGTPLELVSERMGHSNPTVTLNIYRHLLEDERRSHIYDIEEMLSPLAGFSKSAAVKLRSNVRTAVN